MENKNSNKRNNRPTKIDRKDELSFLEKVKPVRNRIMEFYANIHQDLIHDKGGGEDNVETSPLIRDLIIRKCQEEKRKIEKIYPNKNTQHRYFTKYRNAARNSLSSNQLNFYQNQLSGQCLSLPQHLRDAVLQVFKLSKADSDLRSLQQNMQIDVKTNNVALFDMPQFIQTCLQFITVKNDPYTLAVALMGLTGRRPIEILKTGRFRYVDPQHLLFSGQVKTKNSPNARDSYVIPVLTDANVILDALNTIRSLIIVSSRENEAISRSFSNQLLRRVRKMKHCIFPNQHISINCRCLRSIYVASAYNLFNMAVQSSYNAFAARVLGHSLLDKNTANCYTYFSIIQKQPKL